MKYQFVPMNRCCRWASLVACGLALTFQSACANKGADPAAHAQAEQELQQLREANQELAKLKADNQELPRLKRDNEEVQRLQEQIKNLAQLRQENEQLRGQLQSLRPTKTR
jgi:hypothetical protein